MKRVAWFLLFVVGLFWLSIAALPQFGYAEALQQGLVNNRDASGTAIPTAYGSAGAEVFSGLSSRSNIAVINNSSADIGISLGTTSSNCSGGTDNAIVPATGSSVFTGISINTKVCLRSLSGSTISSGFVRTMVW